MLHDDIALGAATARAPATPAGSHDLASPTSDGEDMLDDRAAAAEPDEVQRMLAPPGRVGGMLPDLPSGGPASSAVAPRTATAAATTAPEATAAAPAVRAAMEHRARAEPAHDHATTARTCAEPMQVDATNSRDSRSSKDDEAPVPATYAHDGAQFACALCQYRVRVQPGLLRKDCGNQPRHSMHTTPTASGASYTYCAFPNTQRGGPTTYWAPLRGRSRYRGSSRGHNTERRANRRQDP
ncbi:hypothetical protein PC118_g21489 [Phytophthora cactorum]|uniref:Uncharacterized protein n=1 Tax=Phytophthora cactorum TaxID=29920 RepID=A0A8T1F4N2_9STRA|nr:hypothetical protein PC118_g21489 [Phytophthora cactorum]KAG2968727.1 hypothetical protein PC119_g24136 [Phytophthora cactorum]